VSAGGAPTAGGPEGAPSPASMGMPPDLADMLGGGEDMTTEQEEF
jgi:hypothetical protein